MGLMDVLNGMQNGPRGQRTPGGASSGGGMVTARMNGKKELLKLTIDPAAMSSSASDIELLEDLITAAINECGRRADEAMKSNVQGMMGNMMGGLNLPGLT